MNINQHAYEVVSGFKKSLSAEQLQVLEEENFEELHILVEAAIGAIVSQVLHTHAKELEAMAKKTRHLASMVESVDS